jgi:hypothetical protein
VGYFVPLVLAVSYYGCNGCKMDAEWMENGCGMAVDWMEEWDGSMGWKHGMEE